MRNKAFKIYLCGLLVMMLMVIFVTAVVIRFGFTDGTMSIVIGPHDRDITLFDNTGPVSVVEISQINQRVARCYKPVSEPWLELAGDAGRSEVALSCTDEMAHRMQMELAGDTLRIRLDFADVEARQVDFDAYSTVRVIIPAGRSLTVLQPEPVPLVDELVLSEFDLDSIRLNLRHEVALRMCRVADVETTENVVVEGSEINRLCLKASHGGTNYFNVELRQYCPVGDTCEDGNLDTLTLAASESAKDPLVALTYTGRLPAMIVSEPGLRNEVYLHTADSFVACTDSLLTDEYKKDWYETDD